MSFLQGQFLHSQFSCDDRKTEFGSGTTVCRRNLSECRKGKSNGAVIYILLGLIVF